MKGGKKMPLEKHINYEYCPCLECLLFMMCKMRMDSNFGSLTSVAENEKCGKLTAFMAASDQEKINQGRIRFGLEPY